MLKIAISCDHRGVNSADMIKEIVLSDGHELVSVPACETKSCDYPDMAWGVCRAVVDGKADRGILVCGSGIGMSIAANKVPGIRAALVHDDITAQLSRGHNDANVLCLSSDLIGHTQIETIALKWLNTEFEGGRHARRVKKIAAIEAGVDPSSIE